MLAKISVQEARYWEIKILGYWEIRINKGIVYNKRSIRINLVIR
jgi:hypothetical protein